MKKYFNVVVNYITLSKNGHVKPKSPKTLEQFFKDIIHYHFEPTIYALTYGMKELNSNKKVTI